MKRQIVDGRQYGLIWIALYKGIQTPTAISEYTKIDTSNIHKFLSRMCYGHARMQFPFIKITKKKQGEKEVEYGLNYRGIFEYILREWYKKQDVSDFDFSDWMHVFQETMDEIIYSVENMKMRPLTPNETCVAFWGKYVCELITHPERLNLMHNYMGSMKGHMCDLISIQFKLRPMEEKKNARRKETQSVQ